MRVRILDVITGTRNGVRWPAPGGEKDLPEGEALKLIAAGRAEAVAVAPVKRAEKATARKAEKRG